MASECVLIWMSHKSNGKGTVSPSTPPEEPPGKAEWANRWTPLCEGGLRKECGRKEGAVYVCVHAITNAFGHVHVKSTCVLCVGVCGGGGVCMGGADDSLPQDA